MIISTKDFGDVSMFNAGSKISSILNNVDYGYARYVERYTKETNFKMPKLKKINYTRIEKHDYKFCPNCNSEVGNEIICSDCGVDLIGEEERYNKLE